MKLSYKRIGDYVTQINSRNIDGAISLLLGININKHFMPSVANTIGTDLTKYKVVKQFQFAFNPMHVGRDEVLPIAMLEDSTPAIVSPAYIVFEVTNEKILLPEYFKLLCSRPEFDRHAWFKTDNSVRGGFSWMDFCEMKVPVPTIEKQQDIICKFYALENLIEINQKMNETLEAMAQALFKSWFIDFDPVIDNALLVGNDIPDELVERAQLRQAQLDSGKTNTNSEINNLFPNEFELTEESGWIPKGWKVQDLSSLVTLTGGGTPKTTVKEYWNGDIPWFSVVDSPSLSDVYVLSTEKSITRLGVENSSTKLLPVGTTIISARGTVGKCAMTAFPIAMNQSCYGVNGIEGIGNIFTYYAILLKVSMLQQSGHGSVFNTITKDTFKAIKMPFGGNDLTQRFDELVRPYFDKILINGQQNKTLAKLRDTLLPKLMSGELRISDAEKLVKDI